MSGPTDAYEQLVRDLVIWDAQARCSYYSNRPALLWGHLKFKGFPHEDHGDTVI